MNQSDESHLSLQEMPHLNIKFIDRCRYDLSCKVICTWVTPSVSVMYHVRMTKLMRNHQDPKTHCNKSSTSNSAEVYNKVIHDRPQELEKDPFLEDINAHGCNEWLPSRLIWREPQYCSIHLLQNHNLHQLSSLTGNTTFLNQASNGGYLKQLNLHVPDNADIP